MEKFKIDPNEERKLHEEILKKLDDVTAGILRKRLTYPTPQEGVRQPAEEPPKKTPHQKGPGAFIENSIPESNR